MRRILVLLPLLPLLPLLAACAAPPPAPDLVGDYALVAVDGKPVPCTVAHGPADLEVRSGRFSFRADGTCSTLTVFVPSSGKEVRREVSATWTRDGARVTMRWQNGGRSSGALDGAAFSMDNEGMRFEYRK